MSEGKNLYEQKVKQMKDSANELVVKWMPFILKLNLGQQSADLIEKIKERLEQEEIRDLLISKVKLEFNIREAVCQKLIVAGFEILEGDYQKKAEILAIANVENIKTINEPEVLKTTLENPIVIIFRKGNFKSTVEINSLQPREINARCYLLPQEQEEREEEEIEKYFSQPEDSEDADYYSESTGLYDLERVVEQAVRQAQAKEWEFRKNNREDVEIIHQEQARELRQIALEILGRKNLFTIQIETKKQLETNKIFENKISYFLDKNKPEEVFALVISTGLVTGKVQITAEKIETIPFENEKKTTILKKEQFTSWREAQTGLVNTIPPFPPKEEKIEKTKEKTD